MNKKLIALCTGLLLAGSVNVLAQRGQGGGQGGNFDPEQMRARMMERMQTSLNANADEWKVIEPLLATVMEKQREAATGRFGGMMGRGRAPGGDQAQGGARQGRGGFGGREPNPEVEALSAALESSSTSAAEIQTKLKALRDSRKKSEAELQAAREKLRQVVSVRQEAQLVLMGMLD